MTIFLLDNGPLGHLAAVGARSGWRWGWPASTLHVAEEMVSTEVTGTYTRQLLEQRDGNGGSWIRQHRLVVGSPAQQMYTDRLRPRSSSATKNVGEDASIALLACELTDGVFVTMDAKAAMACLVELGPSRVVSAFDCWSFLFGRGLIDAESRQELDARTARNTSFASPPARLDPSR